MQLSLHADYAFRVLIYLGTHPGMVVTTQDISESYGISKHHLVRVAQTLSEHGYVELLPGRAGGVRLAREPGTIRLGDVFQQTEPHLRLVECFDSATNTCPIIDSCGLRGLLAQGVRAFIDSLNRHTLGDLLDARRRTRLAGVFISARDLVKGRGARPRPDRSRRPHAKSS